jgi:hypothetical protein
VRFFLAISKEYSKSKENLKIKKTLIKLAFLKIHLPIYSSDRFIASQGRSHTLPLCPLQTVSKYTIFLHIKKYNLLIIEG